MADENIHIYSITRTEEDYNIRDQYRENKFDASKSIDSLLRLLETQNSETMEHTIRMRDNAILVGNSLGLSISELCELDLATRLHDIGKITIPENILLKPAKLTDEEFRIMKTHSENGYSIVTASNGLESIASAVRTHHERWDGGGYPLALKKEEIPIMARIISVVDAFDAMTSERPYHGAVDFKDAIVEIIGCRGTHFDPKIVDVFVNVISYKVSNKPGSMFR
ncbi:MAG: HD domain-containing phosphohydrolase [Proteocatella sp.]